MNKMLQKLYARKRLEKEEIWFRLRRRDHVERRNEDTNTRAMAKSIILQMFWRTEIMDNGVKKKSTERIKEKRMSKI